MIGVVRIRGIVKVRADIAETMRLLGLGKKNSCAILEDTPIIRGMLQKVKDYVTYGEVSDDTVKLLDEKRGKTAIKKEKKSVYFLAPPKGGFEKKGIKKTFVQGGALGNRKEAINALIAKMV